MEFSLDIIKLNDFYQTVLKRPMQITQIEAIKWQIAFQRKQMFKVQESSSQAPFRSGLEEDGVVG